MTCRGQELMAAYTPEKKGRDSEQPAQYCRRRTQSEGTTWCDQDSVVRVKETREQNSKPRNRFAQMSSMIITRNSRYCDLNKSIEWPVRRPMGLGVRLSRTKALPTGNASVRTNMKKTLNQPLWPKWRCKLKFQWDSTSHPLVGKMKQVDDTLLVRMQKMRFPPTPTLFY